jgi:hypothetical protein
MATVTKTVLKTYFEQGDIPTQAQYVDLIDSQFGLGESGTQIIQGTISASAARVEFLELKKLYIPGLGISDNVDITDRKGVKVGSTFTVGKTLEVTGDINTTGIISGSSINSSGNIDSLGNITATGTLTAGNTTVGSLVATTLDTGQGATEVHLMNQNVKTTDAVTFTTVNTGQGATEVHLMNQNLRNSDSVTFGNIIGANIRATTGLTVDLEEALEINWSDKSTLTMENKKFSIKFSDLPEIDAKYSGFSDEYMIIANPLIFPEQSVVLVTNSTAFNDQGSQIGMHIANMYDGNFVIKLFHASSTGLNITPGGIAQFNFIII